MLHEPLIVAEIRELDPEDGWTRFEATGRACVVCPCGLNTDFIDKAEAAQQYRDHAQASPTRAAVRHHPETAEASSVMHDMLGEITRD
ncbi:hypothetical protein ACH4KN_33870 [Streptomyces sp. NPDC017546]|uniref:hypothetical protein n=1 Tax=Streptomyces sp. NPDC017546 TaxID=3365001 RepID=UPI00379FEAA1